MSDRSTGSISYWLQELTDLEGDHELAEAELFDRMFARLSALAKKRLPLSTRQAADEEDVAAAALHSFFMRAKRGDFSKLDDRGDLWSLLAKITVCKTIRQIKHEQAEKRGGAKPIRSISDFEETVESMPATELSNQLTIEADHLVSVLQDDTLQRVAMLKLEGFTDREIAEQIEVSLRTVERKLSRIRSIWTDRADVELG